MRILVLGGAGFIGRHVARCLVQRGHAVVIGSRYRAPRDPRLANELRALERRRARMEAMLAADRWLPVIAGFDAVVNSVGILRPRWGESYDAVHHRAVAALALAARSLRIRLVHIAALGLTPDAASGFIRSKWHGERALLASGADAVTVRPSLLDGSDGFGARWLRRIADWPIHFLPSCAHGAMAPLDLDDLALAIAVLCEDPERSGPRIVEVGGADQRTMQEHLRALRTPAARRDAIVVALPPWAARLASHLCDLLHLTPFSYGHLQLMQRDNVPRTNALPALLERAPKPVGQGDCKRGGIQSVPQRRPASAARPGRPSLGRP